MDTTKSYQKMCENWDFQTDRETKAGDFYAISFRSGKPSRKVFVTKDNELFDPNYYTWLPRQDQIQEMIKGESWNKLNRFYTFVLSLKLLDLKMFGIHNSLEKLWFAFYMKEKFNKTWNGKEWK